ncbi:hypothetical protein SARC_10900, partial [Sphaeroforma arctica JP610]
ALLLDLEAPLAPPKPNKVEPIAPVKQETPAQKVADKDSIDDILAELEAANISTKSKSHDKCKTTPTIPPRPNRNKPRTELSVEVVGPQSVEKQETLADTHLPRCTGCKQGIEGEVNTYLGVDWHEGCFKCTTCKEVLTSDLFFQTKGKPYCKDDYEKLNSQKCAYCNKHINDGVVNALGRTWHKDHFFCSQCGVAFNGDPFHEKDGKFFEYETRAYCELHWHGAKGTLCKGCDKPIEGICVTATGGTRYHPEHFTCHYCKKQLMSTTHKQNGEHYFCLTCNIKLFE